MVNKSVGEGMRGEEGVGGGELQLYLSIKS